MLTHEDVTKGGQTARIELLFSPVTFREPYTLHYDESQKTAFWRPPARKGDAHQICVGGKNKYFEGSDRARLAQSLVWHELGHALYTERDLVKVNQILESVGVPFRVFNLFEDARIEARFREETDLQFDWLNFEDIAGTPGAPISAGTLFFRVIQLEGEREAYLKIANDPDLTIPGPDAQAVFEFWERAVACQTTLEIIPVVADWLLQYPEEAIQLPEDADDGLATTLKGLQTGFAPLLQEAAPVPDAPPKPVKGAGNGKGTGSKPAAIVESGNLAEFVAKGPATYTLDTQVIGRLAHALRRGLATGSRGGYGNTPGKRMRPERLAIGKAPFRQLGSAPGSFGVRKVALLLDCSGSMGDAAAGGIQLLAALSDLAIKGEVTGKAIFSKVVDDRAIHVTVPLPVSAEVLTHLLVDGEAEGLEPALRQNRPLLQGHTVFVFSDGSIGDDPIQPQSLHGLAVMGVYCGKDWEREHAEEMMRKYFRVTVARESLDDLALAMASELRRM
jgi:hypothetical protein